MSAPAVERTRTARPAARQPIARRSTGMPAPKDTGGAVGRAYARRAVRERRQSGEENAAAAGRSQFVLLIMVLLGVGLVASLWLSTTAAADSYRLDKARQATRDLSERSESLRTEIASMQSAPALAQAAQQMGMVQVSDVARLVVAPEGTVQVVGTPKAAVAPYVPPPVFAPPAPGQPVDPAQAAAQAAAQGQPGGPSQQTEQPGDATGTTGATGADGQPEQPQVPAEQGPAGQTDGQQLAVTQQSTGAQQSGAQQSGAQQPSPTRQTPQQFAAAAAQAQQQTGTGQQTGTTGGQRSAGAPTQPAAGPGH